MRRLILGFSIILTLTFTGCKEGGNQTLDAYLIGKGDFVHRIDNFYIIGSAAKPTSPETTTGTTGRDVFEHTVKIFSSFLDQNDDGKVDSNRADLLKVLGKHMLFVTGPSKFVDEVSAAYPLQAAGLYAMSMQTDKWPYLKDYNGKGWTISKLDSSTWRPPLMNALWEETFHTITEAYSRSVSSFTFNTGGTLRTLLDAEIAAKTYDISVQNTAEGGNYDRLTAFNEYIHQIYSLCFIYIYGTQFQF